MQYDKNIKVWTAADFERYHRGEMTGAEMHLLEMQALEDPFLQDAIDGYKNAEKAVVDVENLKIKIENRKKKSKIVWFTQKSFTGIAGIAAVFIILAGISWYVYQQKMDISGAGPALAAVQKEKLNAPENSIDSVIDRVTGSEPPEQTKVTEKPGNKVASKPVIKLNKIAKPAMVDDQKTNDHTIAPAAEITKEMMAEKKFENADATGQAASVPNPYLKKTIPVGRSAVGNVAGVNAANFIKGNVIDQQGNPIANAIIVNDKNKTGVQTDAQGKFVYAVPDSTTLVKVSAVGYGTALQDLSIHKVNNDIVLQKQNNELSEVVITAATTKRKKQEASTRLVSPQSISEIKPRAVLLNNVVFTGDIENYNAFINDSMKLPKQPVFNEEANKTILHFDTDDQGNALRIKVLRSYCTACDAVAIRLLQRAPGWQKIKLRKPAELIITY